LRFLANENFPGAAVAALGASDPDVLAWAAREQRILLTFDKDFGELAQRSALPTTCGVVLLRLPMPKPVDVGQRLAELITARDDWPATFPSSSPVAFGCDRSGSLQSISKYPPIGHGRKLSSDRR